MNATMTKDLELISVDADTVVLEDNIRHHVDTDSVDFKALVNSVGEHGVLVPTLGYRAADGTIHIRAGQRRLLAAQHTRQPLPVVVADRGNTEAERILQQLIENDIRVDLTPSQRVKAYAQLELDGLTVAKIAKAVGIPREQIKAAIAISKNPDSLEVIDSQRIDLLHVAATLEFADDPDTRAHLLDYAAENPDQFEHALERARQNRERRLAILAREEELEAAGTIIYRAGELDPNVHSAVASQLKKIDGQPVTIDGQPDLRVSVRHGHTGELQETTYMVNYAAYGYGYGYGYGDYSGGANTGPMTDEQKAERKLLISRNKQWDAATVVRVRWLGEFLARKTFPKDCGVFVAISLGRFGSLLGSRGQNLPTELLGIEHKYRGAYPSALADAVMENPGKAGLITIALILGQHEDGTSRATWRYPSEEHKHYLLQLEAWGYNLATVEKIAAGYDVADSEEADLTTVDGDLDDYVDEATEVD